MARTQIQKPKERRKLSRHKPSKDTGLINAPPIKTSPLHHLLERKFGNRFVISSIGHEEGREQLLFVSKKCGSAAVFDCHTVREPLISGGLFLEFEHRTEYGFWRDGWLFNNSANFLLFYIPEIGECLTVRHGELIKLVGDKKPNKIRNNSRGFMVWYEKLCETGKLWRLTND